MRFDIKKRESPATKQHNTKDVEIAYDFAKAALKEFGGFVRAVVLFGSTTRKDKKHDDIDIMLVIDDVTYYMSSEIVETYRILCQELIVRTSNRIHLTTLKFTSFWEYTHVGDPVIMNVLRTGVALVDTGFFYPMQLLLFSGRIRPSQEAIGTYSSRSATTLFNAKWHILKATLDLYWSVIDITHAALMNVGQLPPDPKDARDAIKKHLVKPGLVSKKCPDVMHKFYTISKRIIYRDIKDINGKDYDSYEKLAKWYTNEMKKVVKP